MRYLSYILALVLILAAFTGCRKLRKNAPAPDSIELHRHGGFGGFMDVYLITEGQVKKAQYNDTIKSIEFTILLPQNNYDAVKHLLTTIPEKFYRDYPQGIRDNTTVSDYMFHYVIVKKGDETYTWDFSQLDMKDVPRYARPYAEELYKAFDVLE